MTIVKPTLGRILRIWLTITARALFLGLAGAILTGVALSIVIAVAGLDMTVAQKISVAAGPAVAIPVSLYAIIRQLGRKCGDVRLVLISAE
jgi:hypothetical protein